MPVVGATVRFAASTGYTGVVGYLGLEEPASLFEHSENREAYPKLNAQAETKLREELGKFADLSPEDARQRIAELEKEHCWRRETVWAGRGESPLARSLAHLAIVANAKSLPSHDGAALADAYVSEGAGIDWAAMSALAAAPREVDRVAVTAALRAVYLPWLEESAIALQELVRTGKVRFAVPGAMEPTATTILFVDGCRVDHGRVEEFATSQHRARAR